MALTDNSNDNVPEDELDLADELAALRDDPDLEDEALEMYEDEVVDFFSTDFDDED